MEAKPVQYYSDALLDASLAFLVNGKLLWPYVMTTFLKTATRDVSTIMKTLEITTKWFHKIYSEGILIPPNFDFNFLMKGINILLELDHGTSTAKVLWFLYQILHVIPKLEREELLKNLLAPKCFYSLFFHWSYNVRMCFYYFYYFQLHRIIIDNKEVQEDLHQSI